LISPLYEIKREKGEGERGENKERKIERKGKREKEWVGER
jgi:hypothetical protein